MLTKDQREEKDDNLKNSKAYWIFIGAGAFVFLLLAWWAMIHVNNKMIAARNNLRPMMKTGLILSLVIIVLFVLFIAFLNFLGKKEERDEHS